MKIEIEKIAKGSPYGFLSGLKELEKQVSNLPEEKQDDYLEVFYDEFNQFISDNPEYTYLVKVVQKFTQNWEFYSYYADEDNLRERFAISVDDLRDSNLLEIVLEKEGINSDDVNNDDDVFFNFVNLTLSYFVFSLDNLIDENDADELAEFIFSISSNTYSDIVDDENYIPDLVSDIISLGYGFNISDYEGDCTISPNYHLSSEVSSGYDYISMSQDIIDELYCP